MVAVAHRADGVTVPAPGAVRQPLGVAASPQLAAGDDFAAGGVLGKRDAQVPVELEALGLIGVVRDLQGDDVDRESVLGNDVLP